MNLEEADAVLALAEEGVDGVFCVVGEGFVWDGGLVLVDYDDTK